jgi:hypothetical protein
VKFLGCFLDLSFDLVAIPAQANAVALFGGVQPLGETLNIIQVSLGVAFSI